MTTYLKVGDLKKLLEGVDDEMPLAVELTNVPPGFPPTSIPRQIAIRVTGVWHRGSSGETETFVLAGYSPSIRLRRSKTSQKIQPL